MRDKVVIGLPSYEDTLTKLQWKRFKVIRKLQIVYKYYRKNLSMTLHYTKVSTITSALITRCAAAIDTKANDAISGNT